MRLHPGARVAGDPEDDARPPDAPHRLGALVFALLGLGLATLLGPSAQARVAGVALVVGALALGLASIAEHAGRRLGRRPGTRTPHAKRKP